MDKSIPAPRVADMVELHLKSIGAVGLVNTYLKCGCRIGDLAPCDQLGLDCLAAQCETLAEPHGDYDAGDLMFTPLVRVSEEEGGPSDLTTLRLGTENTITDVDLDE